MLQGAVLAQCAARDRLLRPFDILLPAKNPSDHLQAGEGGGTEVDVRRVLDHGGRGGQ